jgi:hypothetical protein
VLERFHPCGNSSFPYVTITNFSESSTASALVA